MNMLTKVFKQNDPWLILTILYIKIKVSFKPNAIEMC